MWVWNNDSQKMENREITYVPGLFKIFDEIIVNAADNKVRDPKMSLIKINIDKEKNEISIFNNGAGIPVQIHAKEQMYVAEMIFGNLLTSSNYDDDEKKTTGGRNGYGAKLCNIFSTKFIIETADKKRKFKMIWEKNMKKKSEPKVTPYDKDEYTKELIKKIPVFDFSPMFERVRLSRKFIFSSLKRLHFIRIWKNLK